MAGLELNKKGAAPLKVALGALEETPLGPAVDKDVLKMVH